MNLYLISQNANTDYDSYDSAVVACKRNDEAKHTHPDDNYIWDYDTSKFVYADTRYGDCYDGTWALPKDVKVELIGKADPGIEGVICTSFNAG